jgi:hypothetical protein
MGRIKATLFRLRNKPVHPILNSLVCVLIRTRFNLRSIISPMLLQRANGTTRLKEISKEDIDARIQQFVQLVNFDIELL